MATITINKTLINAPAADVVLTSNMSGTTFICTPGAANHIVTLPSPLIPGLRYSFIHSAIVAYSITFNAGAGLLRGYYVLDGAVTGIAGSASIAFTATATPGDVIEMLSDGTNWYTTGNTSAAAGLAVV